MPLAILRWSSWHWDLDELFFRINGETHYLWLTVDHEGEVLEAFVSTRRPRKAALRIPKKAMKRYGHADVIVTDRLPSYPAALCEIGNQACHETGRWLGNRTENSHQPFRRREQAMARLRLRCPATLQKFASADGSIHNHFNHDRHHKIWSWLDG